MAATGRLFKGIRRSAAVALGATLAIVVPGIAPAAAAGAAKPAIFDRGAWYLRNSLSSGSANQTFRYGRTGDLPVMGDWNGDGTDTVGLARFPAGGSGQFTWHLRDFNSGGNATIAPFQFGTVRFVAVDRLGSIPIAGDWDGNGTVTVGVAQFGDNLAGPITFHLRNSNTAGPDDVVVSYGRTDRDFPIVGDWDGNGTDTVGVVRGPNLWLLRNSSGNGPAEVSFAYGSAQPGLIEFPVVGDWNGDGTDNPGLVRNVPATQPEGGFRNWLLRSSNSSGGATSNFLYGSDAFFMGLPVDYVPRLSWR
ncbi:MAG: hypothetical protein ABI912_00680 [Actinomycetota bacterium]